VRYLTGVGFPPLRMVLKLCRQPSQNPHGLVKIPGSRTVQAQKPVEASAQRKDATRRQPDPFLQGRPEKRQGIGPSGQFNPKEETALGIGNPGSGRELPGDAATQLGNTRPDAWDQMPKVAFKHPRNQAFRGYSPIFLFCICFGSLAGGLLVPYRRGHAPASPFRGGFDDR